MIKYNENLDYRLTLVSDSIVRKKAKAHNGEFQVIEAIVKHFMRYPDPMVVPVYSFEMLDKPTSTFGMYTYTYDMMRLGMLNVEEKMIMSHLISESRNVETYHSDERKDYPRLVDFMNKVINQHRFGDLHTGNVLKDLDEDYRLIDLESFWLGMDLKDPMYDWISR